ncbi:hypothetical protein TorRG33x02_216930, partial [Trema orientale]
MADYNEAPGLSAQIETLNAQMNEKQEKIERLDAKLLVRVESLTIQLTMEQPSWLSVVVNLMQSLDDLTPIANRSKKSLYEQDPSAST